MKYIQVGQKFDSYYGNGDYIGEKTIARVTEHSVFFERGQRESIRTVLSNIETGLYRPKYKP